MTPPRILAIAAHPDDETLGCGGTLLKWKAAGAELFWLIATEPKEPHWSAETIRCKAAEVESVAEAYGFAQHLQLGFASGELDHMALRDVMGPLGKVVARIKPTTVCVVHGGDIHSDHRTLFAATTSVLKPFRMAELGVRRILSYETLSSTDASVPGIWASGFLVNVFEDISPYLKRKIEIMELYHTEVQAPLLPRSASAIQALARYRGATIGVEYAEAFVLLREVK